MVMRFRKRNMELFDRVTWFELMTRKMYLLGQGTICEAFILLSEEERILSVGGRI